MKRNLFLALIAILGAMSTVMARQIPNPLLYYTFNGSGTTVPSEGTITASLILQNASGKRAPLRSRDGLGVSGLPGDGAFDNTGSTGMGKAGEGGVALLPPGTLPTLRSFTFATWARVNTKISRWARLMDDGTISIAAVNGALRLHVNNNHGGVKSDRGAYTQVGEWMFIGVTYDSTKATNNIAFYEGTRARPVKPVGTATWDGGAVSQGRSDWLGIGNARNVITHRALQGYVDDVRLYGSRKDGSGVLTQAELEEVRKKDIEYPSVPLAPVIVSATNAEGLADKAFDYQIEASNAPVSFGALGLPRDLGLSLDPLTGEISGIPMESGTFKAIMTATNLGGSGDAPLELIMGEPSGEKEEAVADQKNEHSKDSASEAKKHHPDLQTLKGSYVGLGALDGTNDALFTVSVRSGGAFTGKLTTGTDGFPIDGHFSTDGTFDGTTDDGALRVALSLDSGALGISGTVSSGALAYTVDGSLLGSFSPANPPALPPGRYTAVIPGITGTDPAIPQGNGYGLMDVTDTGLVSIHGKLGDGTPFNTRGQLDADGRTWTLFDTLYSAHRHGTLAGTMTFGTCSYCDCSGTVDWVQPVETGSDDYAAGFALRLEMVAAQYSAPPLASGTATITLTGGSIVDLAGISDELLISPKNEATVTGANTGNVAIEIKPETGEFSGSFTNLGASAVTPFTGVIYQKPSPGGFGVFRETGQSGAVNVTQ